MILVDSALQRRAELGNPVTVGIFGAGFLGKSMAYQIINAIQGMRLVAICTRRIENAIAAYAEAGVKPEVVGSAPALEDAVRHGQYAVCEDSDVICKAEGIDAVVDATGAVEFGARVAMNALRNGKHFVMNAELDATLGPILKVHADKQGLVVTAIDGDQPGTQLNLYRFVCGLGLTPLVCGNIKALQDAYRTPATQEQFARKWGLNPKMATQFADGTKISFEQASVANATRMRVAKRGMLGYSHTGHVDELTSLYDVKELLSWGGIVDYVLGATPSPGVYILATHQDPKHQHHLRLYKMGEGPLYSFYTPYHLAHLEAPSAIARAVLFQDAVVAAKGEPVVEVVAIAKTDLRNGNALDGIGGFTTYGQCENSTVARKENLLPIGLAEGCRLKRDVNRDEVLTYDDVVIPEGRVCDRLWEEQLALSGWPLAVEV
jgi:predicted homoserine dehydrogenase-like protein